MYNVGDIVRYKDSDLAMVIETVPLCLTTDTQMLTDVHVNDISMYLSRDDVLKQFREAICTMAR